MSDGPWGLVIAGTARRDLTRVRERYATAVVESLPVIAENPRRLGKPLKFDYGGRWAARRGPYRVIYALDEERHLVRVLAVAHRADVYRRR